LALGSCLLRCTVRFRLGSKGADELRDCRRQVLLDNRTSTARLLIIAPFTSERPLIEKGFSGAEYRGRIALMIHAYARVSTRDLLDILATVAEKKAGFRSLGDTWADTTTSYGRLMLTVLGGLAEFERDLIARAPAKAGRAPWQTASSSAGSRRSHLISGAKRSSASTPKRKRSARSRAPTMSAAGRFRGCRMTFMRDLWA
jgi:hypothetical protein